MSNIPDILLHRAVVNGIRAIRKDPKILNSLFRAITQKERDSLKDFILHKSIQFVANYPKSEQLAVPAIILTMQNESESETFLGDILGSRPYYDFPSQDTIVDTLGGNGASVSTLSNLNTKIIGNVRIDHTGVCPNKNKTLVYWDNNFSSEIHRTFANTPTACYTMFIVRGRGAGQKSVIDSIDSDKFVLRDHLNVDLNSTSYIDIRYTTESGHADGEPPRVYEEDDTALMGKGTNYEARYQLGIVAGTQKEVIFLYSILKAILISQRVYLEDQGMQAMTISGAEFSPKNEYLPSIVYGRALNISFKYTFSFVEELTQYSAISINLTTPCMTTPCSAIEFEVKI